MTEQDIPISGGFVRDGQIYIDNYDPLKPENWHRFRKEIAQAGVKELHFLYVDSKLCEFQIQSKQSSK